MTDQELKQKKADLRALRNEREKLLIDAKIEKAKMELELAKMTPEEKEEEANRLMNEEKKKDPILDALNAADKWMKTEVPGNLKPFYWLTVLAAVGVIALIFII